MTDKEKLLAIKKEIENMRECDNIMAIKSDYYRDKSRILKQVLDIINKYIEKKS